MPFPAEGACTAELQDLLRKCLCKDPLRRPSAEALIRHPWLQQVCPAVADCSAYVLSLAQLGRVLQPVCLEANYLQQAAWAVHAMLDLQAWRLCRLHKSCS